MIIIGIGERDCFSLKYVRIAMPIADHRYLMCETDLAVDIQPNPSLTAM